MSDRQTRTVFLALAEGRDLTVEQGEHLASCRECQDAAGAAARFEEELAGHARWVAPEPMPPGLVPDLAAPTAGRPAVRVVAVAAAATMLAAGIGYGGFLLGRADTSPEPSELIPSSRAATPSVRSELLVAGDRAEVVHPALSASAVPGTNAFSPVDQGVAVHVIEARTTPSGSWWYLVQFHRGPADLFGWVPADRDGSPTLRRLAPADCGDEPSVTWLAGLDPQDRLRCWGGQQLLIEGYLVEEAVAPTYVGQPEWLASESGYRLASIIAPAAMGGAIPVHFREGVALPPLSELDTSATAVRIRLIGRYDHPWAVQCERDPVDTALPELSGELNELWCRQQFVVGDVEILDEPTRVPVVQGPLHCVNVADGYAIDVPPGWWTNGSSAGVSACRWLAPEGFSVSIFPGQEPTLEGTNAFIHLSVSPARSDLFDVDPPNLLTRQDLTVAGWPAVALEWEFNPPDRVYAYVVAMGASLDAGPTFHASVGSYRIGPRYPAYKAALDEIIASLMLEGTAPD